MIRYGRVFTVIVVFCILTTSQINLLAVLTQAEIERALKAVNNCILRVNEAMGLAHSSNGTAIKAFEAATQAQILLEQLKTDLDKLQNDVSGLRDAVPQFQREIIEITQQQKNDLARWAENLKERARSAETIEVNLAKARVEAEIAAKSRYGIYEKEARILGQAHIDGETAREKARWAGLRDSKLIAGYVLAVTALAFSVYTIKYGVPMILNNYNLPHVISETSIGRSKQRDACRVDDLVFVPSLQQQLSDLLVRVHHAKKYKGTYPNVLFYGASGTGKTAFAKALAYASGLDYALTSGAEFTKITDLKIVNDELRKLLLWAKKSSKGLVIFIDEAESLFASRKLSSTPRQTQELINTFLSIISDQFQKKVMFIFATNHPNKIDDAIINRVGVPIEFILPGALEREKILFFYLSTFAQENKNLHVDVHPEVKRFLGVYAEELKGFSPRALKFIAQEMVVKAQLSPARQVTTDIAQAVICEAKKGQLQLAQWSKANA